MKFLFFLFSLVSLNLANKPATSEIFATREPHVNFQSQKHLTGQKTQDTTGEMVKFTTPGGKTAGAYFIKAQRQSDSYLFVFHDSHGLTDHVKKEAEKLYKDLEDVNILAIDLYGGKVAQDKNQAKELAENIEDEPIEDIIEGAIDFASKNARIATVGWGFGGSWSLVAAIIAGRHSVASVMYYGEPEGDKDKLKMLQAPVLGIFAAKDDAIGAAVLEEFDEEMDEVERELDIEIFAAQRGFANPENENFDEKAAAKANKKALKFLKKGFERGYF